MTLEEEPTLCDICGQPLKNIYDEALIDLALCAQCNEPGEVVAWLVPIDMRV